jgi:uncharacterized repeat protein (TIGR01451 family)
MTVDASPNPLIETGLPGQVPTATLTVTKSDNFGGSSPSTPGQIPGCDTAFIKYTIKVTNAGPAALNGVKVTDAFSSNGNFSGDSYSATATGGATGFTATATGTPFADINDTVNLPAGSTITYTVVATLANAGNGLSNTVTLTPPAGAVLNAGSTTTATDTDNSAPC